MNNSKSQTVAIISYITWIGLIIAFFMRDKDDSYATHHVNQSLVIKLTELCAGLLTVIPLIGSIAAMVAAVGCTVLWIIGILRAIQGSTEPVPLVGNIKIIS